jgi:hypothetical protein
VLAALDAAPKPEPVARPLAVGDRIRILKARHYGAAVQVGDVLKVVRPVRADGRFYTEAPRAVYQDTWVFTTEHEGTGWERVTA